MNCYQININDVMWNVYRFPYEPVDSNMFFIPDKKTGVVFDPNENDELLVLFKKYGTEKITIVLTHEHYDHTNGTKWLQSKIQTTLFCQSNCAKSIASTKGNDSKLVAFVLASKDAKDQGHRYRDFKSTFKKYFLYADKTFDKEYNLNVSNIRIECHSTPGHSPGSAMYTWGDKIVFTGDSLIQNTPTVLRFPESDKELYNEITRPFLKSLNKNMMVFPGHGDPFIISEAKYL